MTRADVLRRVKEIRELADYDPEAAHGREDQLHRDVLRHIAENGGSMMMVEVKDLCTAALKTQDIKFPRYCA